MRIDFAVSHVYFMHPIEQTHLCETKNRGRWFVQLAYPHLSINVSDLSLLANIVLWPLRIIDQLFPHAWSDWNDWLQRFCRDRVHLPWSLHGGTIWYDTVRYNQPPDCVLPVVCFWNWSPIRVFASSVFYKHSRFIGTPQEVILSSWPPYMRS